MSTRRILHSYGGFVLLSLLPLLFAPTLAAQDAARPGTDDSVGVVVVAHGSGPDWNAPVLELAATADVAGPVEVAFLMGEAAPEHRFQDAVAALEAAGVDRVVVVPLLVSSHSGHYEQIRYLTGEVDELSDTMLHHLHMAGIERPTTELPIHLTPAFDASPEVATIMADRALALVDGEASTQAVYLVGHGPNSAEDHAEWMASLRTIAEGVRSEGRFADVRTGTVRDDAPEAVRSEAVRSVREVIELQAAATERDVIVVPLLISKGWLSTQKLPGDLEGLSIRYDGEGILPHPVVADWLARRVAESVAAAQAQR